MHQRIYWANRKRVNKDGTIHIVKQRCIKWIKTKKMQRKYRTGGQRKTLWSKRFGYLDAYSSAEQKLLVCPSGYTFGQGMNKLYKLWYGFKMNKDRASIKGMERYAREIQKTEDDLGLNTSSFPHLGIYGDLLVFTDHSTGKNIVEIDQSHLKEKQDMEKAKEKFEESIPLIEPDLEKGEELVTFPDEIPQPKIKIKHGNRMHYKKKKDEDHYCEDCGEMIPRGKTHICEYKKTEEEESVVMMTDDIPFM